MTNKNLKDEAILESLLLEGLNSGEPMEFTDEVLETIGQRLQKRLAGGER